MASEELKGHTMAFVATVIWALSILVTKDAVANTTPLQTVFMRFLLAAIALWAICPKWNFDKKQDLKILVLSLLCGSMYMLLFNYGAMYTYASNVSIINCTSPIFTALIIMIFFREPVGRNQAIGYIVAFVGIVLVILNGASNPQINPIGDLMIVATSLLWATYCVLTPKFKIECDPVMTTRKIMTYGVLVILPFALVDMPNWDFAEMTTMSSIFDYAYLGLLASATAYLLWNKGLSKIGALKTQFYVYLQPVITLVAAVLVSGENVTLMGMAGFIIVLSGLVVSNLRRLPHR